MAVENKVSGTGISDTVLSQTVQFSVVPPWTLKEVRVDLNLLKKEKGRNMGKSEVSKYIEENYSEYVQVYTIH